VFFSARLWLFQISLALERDGYVFLRGILPQKAVGAAEARVRKVLAGGGKAGTSGKGQLLSGLLDEDPAISELLGQHALLQVLERLNCAENRASTTWIRAGALILWLLSFFPTLFSLYLCYPLSLPSPVYPPSDFVFTGFQWGVENTLGSIQMHFGSLEQSSWLSGSPS
jgi:hypothetical protein